MPTPLSSTEAIAYVATFTGKKPATRTFRRWCVVGVTGPMGQKIKLGSRVIGGRRYTIREEVDAFIEERNREPEFSLSVKGEFLAGPAGRQLAGRNTDTLKALRDEFGITLSDPFDTQNQNQETIEE